MRTQRLLVLLLLYILCYKNNTAEADFGYVSNTDVSEYLKLATDIQSIQDAPNINVKKDIYMNGGNYKSNSNISLASLSLTSKENFGDLPIYNVYLSTFENLGFNNEKDVFGQFDGRPVEEYANTLINDLLLLNITNIVETGVVILNVLMAIWGYLGRMLQACHDNDSKIVMNTALDTAVALWVGEGQIRDDNDSGFLMYHLTEQAGAQFGQDDSEALTNTKVFELFINLQSNINNNDFCAVTSKAETNFDIMRNDVRTIIELSNVVLVQMLLHYIEDVVDGNQSSDFVALTTLAVIPQIAACDTELYNTLLDLTVYSSITPSMRNQVIRNIQQSYSCLGITCNDVGSYMDGRIPVCTEPDQTAEPTFTPTPTPLSVFPNSNTVPTVQPTERPTLMQSTLSPVTQSKCFLMTYSTWGITVTMMTVGQIALF